MQSLLRLAGWGMAASVAIAMAAVISHSSRGQQRLSVVAAAVTGTPTTKGAFRHSAYRQRRQYGGLAPTRVEPGC